MNRKGLWRAVDYYTLIKNNELVNFSIVSFQFHPNIWLVHLIGDRYDMQAWNNQYYNGDILYVSYR